MAIPFKLLVCACMAVSSKLLVCASAVYAYCGHDIYILSIGAGNGLCRELEYEDSVEIS